MKQTKEMMVYVMLGFLEAGKTSLIQDLLQDELFDLREKTLIVACEEGEEEYSPAFLAKTGAACEYVEEEDEFNRSLMEYFLGKHKPTRMILEYNGMWQISHIQELYDQLQDICFDRPVIFQIIDVVNDESFNLYMKNMPSLMVEHFRISDMIIVNRCTLDTKRLAIRGSVKAVNPKAQIVYESTDDAFYEQKEEMPFDVNADVISINDADFGLWYIDMSDHEANYVGKTLRVTGMIQKPKALEAKYVVFGRYAMTCCADDVQYLGFLCEAADWSAYEDEDYVTVEAELVVRYQKEYGEEGPVLIAKSVTRAAEPKEEMVYFT